MASSICESKAPSLCIIIYYLLLLLKWIPLQDTPRIPMPDASLSKQTRAKWLLEICEEHVQKYVFNKDEMTSLITQTTELEQALNQDCMWTCRADNCDRTYAYHSGRVRYNLSCQYM